jgi:hypothetical protein
MLDEVLKPLLDILSIDGYRSFYVDFFKKRSGFNRISPEEL